MLYHGTYQTVLVMILHEQLTARPGNTSLTGPDKIAKTASVATIRTNHCSMTVTCVSILKQPHRSAARVLMTANVSISLSNDRTFAVLITYTFHIYKTIVPL